MKNKLFNEIEFFEKTGLTESLRLKEQNDSVKLEDIEIITPQVLRRIEKNFYFFLKFGGNPF